MQEQVLSNEQRGNEGQVGVWASGWMSSSRCMPKRIGTMCFQTCGGPFYGGRVDVSFKAL